MWLTYLTKNDRGFRDQNTVSLATKHYGSMHKANYIGKSSSRHASVYLQYSFSKVWQKLNKLRLLIEDVMSVFSLQKMKANFARFCLK